MTGEEPRAMRRPLSPVDAALVAEACSRSDLVWLRPAGQERARAAWHVWHEDAVCVVSGGGEQELPPLRGEVEVIARSKDNGVRIVGFVAEAEYPAAGSPLWNGVAGALAAARLNAAAPAEQLSRWAEGSSVTMLRPIGVTAAGPGDDRSAAGAAPPPGGPGTTLRRRPFHLGTRTRRAARLRRGRG